MSGFQLARNQATSAYPAPLETFIFTGDGTNAAIAVGDIVQFDAAVPSSTGIMSCTRGTLTVDGGNQLGVVMGNSIDPDNEVVGIPLNFNGTREVYVNTNGAALYEVEVDFSVAEVVIADIGLNIGLVAGTSIVGSLSTSAMKVDGNAKATSAIYPYRIIAISEFQAGSTVNAAKVIVKINETFFQKGQDGA